MAILIRSLVPALLVLTVITSVKAETDSVLTLTLKADLDELTSSLEQVIPLTLYEAPARREICVKPEQVCTKIPEIRGLKIYSRMQCMDVSPAISCDVSQKVVRSGNIELTGKGSALILTETISGEATVNGRGTIGRHIRQSVRGTAQVTAHLTGSIGSDWVPQGSIEISHRWINTPAINLFGSIPITVGTEADRVIERQKTVLYNQLTHKLEGLDIRSGIEQLWQELQVPVPLHESVNGNPLYLHIQPEKTAFSGVQFTAGTVEAAAAIRGEIRISDSDKRPWTDMESLPALSELSTDVPGFSVQVPIAVRMQTLNRHITTELPLIADIDSIADGARVKIDSLSFISEERRLLASATLQIFLGESASAVYDGEAVFSARPVWDDETQSLTLDDIRMENGLNALVRSVLRAAQFSGLITRSVNIPLQQELASVREHLNGAVNRSLSKGVRLSGDFKDLGIRGISIEDDAVKVQSSAEGRLDIVLDLSE